VATVAKALPAQSNHMAPRPTNHMMRDTMPTLVCERPASVCIAGDVYGLSDVGFTVINYNTAAQTLRCIASLAVCTPPPAWIMVLDNASKEADFDQLINGVQTATQSQIRIFRSQTNLGFAAGSNFLIDQLLKVKDCQYIGLLNNDAVALPDLVKVLRTALAPGPQPIGMSGARMHKLNNPQQVDTLGISVYASLMPADRKDIADPYLGPTGGCCMMTRDFVHDVITTTGYCFDARFFCYCEDTDLALRANLLGYQPSYSDQMLALHEGQASSNTAPSNFIAYHGLRNAIWMHFKCLPNRLLLRHVHWLLLAHGLTIVRQTLSGRAGVMFSVYRDALAAIKPIRQEHKNLQLLSRISTERWQSLISRNFYRAGYTRQVLRGWLHL
jgi:GT2 family glycosyltransferase